MKWNHRIAPGSKRKRWKFLWLPTRVGNESRWLESAYVEERFEGGGSSMEDAFWRVTKFLDSEIPSDGVIYEPERADK